MNKTKVCILIDEIYALAHILSLLFEEVESNDIHVNPHAVTRIGEMIASNIIQISECFHEKHKPP